MSIASDSSLESRRQPIEGARRALRVAWISVIAMPVALVAAMVLGEWLLSLQGYESGTATAPIGAVLTAGLPALLLLIAPTIPAVWYGRRAMRLGLSDGRVPVVIGYVVAAASLVVNVFGLVVGWLLE